MWSSSWICHRVNSCSSFCCMQYRNFQSSSPLHQNITRKHTKVKQGTCLLNGTFPPLFWHTYILNPLNCWGDSCYVTTTNTTAGSGGHPSGATCEVTVGFPSLAWSQICMNTHIHVQCSVTASWSHPFLAPCAALSTVQNRSHSKIRVCAEP